MRVRGTILAGAMLALFTVLPSCAELPYRSAQGVPTATLSTEPAAAPVDLGPCALPPPGVAPSIELYTSATRPLPPLLPEDGLGAGRSWYLEGRPIPFQRVQYVPYSSRLTTRPIAPVPAAEIAPRQVAEEVIYCGEYDGVPIYTLPPSERYPRSRTGWLEGCAIPIAMHPPLESFPRFVFIKLDRAGEFQRYSTVWETALYRPPISFPDCAPDR